MNIVITEKERKIVNDILFSTLPEEVKVYIFGSRVKGTTKKYADLDIALKGQSILSQNLIDTLKIKFDDSLLPYKVDIVDLNNIDKDFYDAIRHDLMLFD